MKQLNKLQDRLLTLEEGEIAFPEFYGCAEKQGIECYESVLGDNLVIMLQIPIQGKLPESIVVKPTEAYNRWRALQI